MRSNPHYSNLHQPPSHTSRRSVDYAALLVGLGALAVILPLCFLSLSIVTFQVLELNLPGVHVYNQSVGLTSWEDTVTLVDTAWNQDIRIRLLNPNHPSDSVIVTPEELGIWVDPIRTADAAYRFGRGPDPFADLLAAASGRPQVVMPTVLVDQVKAQEFIQLIADNINEMPVNASLTYQAGDWIVIPGKDGQELDLDAVLEDLLMNTEIILITGILQLQSRKIAPEVMDFSPVLSEIEALVDQDLVFNAYDPIRDEHLSWSVPLDNKRDWITVDPESSAVRMGFDPDVFSKLIVSWESDLGEDRSFDLPDDLSLLIENWENGQPVQTFIRYAPTTYQVNPGESLWSISLRLGIPMWYIMNANEGLTANNLQTGMVLNIPSKNDLLPLPVLPNKRIVIDIPTQRMTVYEDGQVRSTHVISTGIEDSPTMAGIFQVQTHSLNAYASNWDLYMPHFLGIYEAWPGFMNGIHGLPTLSSGQRLWAGNLGQPVSYGCIIMNLAEAEALYYWAEPGVVVEITK